MTPSGISANTGNTQGDKKWVNEVTSLNANEKIKVTVNENSTLTGASITNLDKDGTDKGNLEFSTKTLVTSDIKDHDTYESTTMGVGIGSNDNKPSLNSMQYTNNTKDKEQTNRATVGKGTLTTNSDTTNLNRDTSKIQQITKDESSNLELYASDNSINALLDPEKAYNDLKQSAKDVGLAAHKEIVENLPSASKGKDGQGDFIDNTIGKVLDSVSFAGILPSQANGGGYVTQIATQLFGDNRNILQTTDESKLIALGLDKSKGDYVQTTINGQTAYVTNPNKTVRITQDAKPDGNLDDMKLYISEADAKEMGIDHLFTNGIMNTIAEALANQQEQQGNPEISMLNYNQTHGLAGDALEMTQEKLAVTTNLTQLATGSARQTGDIKTQLTQLNDGNLASASHSQGTMQDYLGTLLNKETIATLVQNNPDAKYTTQYSGSPVSSDATSELVSEIYGGTEGIQSHLQNQDASISDVFRSQVNPGDPVALLGGNTAGINNQTNFLSNATEALTHGTWTLFSGKDGNGVVSLLNDPNSPSPHSGYGCVIGCGEGGTTPKFGQYIDANKQEPDYLQNFYLKINTDPTISNVYNPSIIYGENR
jgi:filamentous hemagglutinin